MCPLPCQPPLGLLQNLTPGCCALPFGNKREANMSDAFSTYENQPCRCCSSQLPEQAPYLSPLPVTGSDWDHSIHFCIRVCSSRGGMARQEVRLQWVSRFGAIGAPLRAQSCGRRGTARAARGRRTVQAFPPSAGCCEGAGAPAAARPAAAPQTPPRRPGYVTWPCQRLVSRQMT
jgi:hypothetical protein